MSDEELPSVTWTGSCTVFGVELICHVLSDGRQIIEAESMHRLLEAMASPQPGDPGDITEFAKWRLA